MRDVDGEFVLEDQGDGTTLATYSLRIDPGMWVPGKVAVDAHRPGDAALGRGPQGARRGRRLTAWPRTVLILHSSAGRYGADLQLLAIARGLDPRALARGLRAARARASWPPLLEEAGAEVVVHPLAVLRRALAGARRRCPAGARVAPRPARARRAGAASAASPWSTPTRRSCSRAARSPARPGRRTWSTCARSTGRRRAPRGPAVAADAPAARCARTPSPASRDAVARAVRRRAERAVIHDGLPARRGRRPARRRPARPLGVPAGRVRGRAGRPHQRLEGPGRARPRARRAAAGGDRRGRRRRGRRRCPAPRRRAQPGRPRGAARRRRPADAARLPRRTSDAVLGAADALAVPSHAARAARAGGARGARRPACPWWHSDTEAWRRSSATARRGRWCRRATRRRWPRRCARWPTTPPRRGGWAPPARRTSPERFGLERMLGELQALYERAGRGLSEPRRGTATAETAIAPITDATPMAPDASSIGTSCGTRTRSGRSNMTAAAERAADQAPDMPADRDVRGW